MAAFDDDTAPDLDIFEGKQWEEWASAMTSTKKHTDIKKIKNSAEVSKLKRSDIKLFGHCPARDDFFLVLCDFCGHPVKPQAIRLHIEKYHKSKKIYVKTSSKSKGQKSSSKNHKISSSVQYPPLHSSSENDKTQRSIMSCGPTSKVGIILKIANKPTPPSDSIASSSPVSVKSSSSAEGGSSSSHSSKVSTSKHDMQKIRKSSTHLSPVKTTSPHLQESSKHHTKASKDLHKIINKMDNINSEKDYSNSKHNNKSYKKSLPSHNNSPLHLKQDTAPSSSMDKEIMHKKSHSNKQHSKKVSNDSSTVNMKSPHGEVNVITNANKVPNIILPPPKQKKNIPIKDRQYDPNKHCGVNVTKGEESLPCRRSLTCKNHSLSAKRSVPGRKKTFDQLLSEHSANNKSRLNSSNQAAVEKDSKPTVILSSPQPSTAVSSSDQFLAPTPPPAKIRTSKPKQPSGNAQPSKPSASLIPKIFSPWHVDCWDSDSDNSDEAPLLNEVNYIPRHPVPLAVSLSSAGLLANSSMRKFNRRLQKLSNDFICKTSSKNKTIAAFQPRFCAVSNASYTINHIKHSVECSAQQHCPSSLIEQNSFADPNVLLTNPSNCVTNKQIINSNIEMKRISTPPNTSINVTEKRTKTKPAKRKSSMSDLNQVKVTAASANTLLRNRSKSVNLTTKGHNYSNHEIIGTQSEVGNNVLKNLLTTGKILPNFQMQNFGHGQMPSTIITSDSNNATVGSYTVINPGQLSTGNSMHVIQMPSGKSRTASMPQKRNAKGQFVEILKNTNHIAINCESMENAKKVKSDEAIHINGLSVSRNTDLMNWHTNGPLSTAISNTNSVDLTATDDIDKIITV